MTGTVQECELELSKQPGEVSQGPANLLTFLSTRREKKRGGGEVRWCLRNQCDAYSVMYTEEGSNSARSDSHRLMTEIFPELRVKMNFHK